MSLPAAWVQLKHSLMSQCVSHLFIGVFSCFFRLHGLNFAPKPKTMQKKWSSRHVVSRNNVSLFCTENVRQWGGGHWCYTAVFSRRSSPSSITAKLPRGTKTEKKGIKLQKVNFGWKEIWGREKGEEEIKGIVLHYKHSAMMFLFIGSKFVFINPAWISWFG